MRPWEIRRERNIAKKVRAKKNKEIIASLEMLLDAEYCPSDRHFYYKNPVDGWGSIHRRFVFPKPEHEL